MNVCIDVSNIILTTKRLILRPWEWNDLDDLFEYASVDGVGQMAGWLPHEIIEDSLGQLQVFIEERNAFAIEIDGKVIGSISFLRYPANELPEFGDKKGIEIAYAINKDYWGMGITPEALSRVIDYLFNEEKLDFLVCGHYVFNERSRRVQEKCGFKHYKKVVARDAYLEKVDCWLSILENKLFN